MVTGRDGPDHPTIGGYLTDRYIMNRVGQKVRYVGDFVAAVAATDEQIAEAACKLIKVEYEPLPYVLDVEEAFREDCPAVVHEDVQSYKRLDLHGVAHCMDKKHPNQAIRRKVRHSESFDLDPDSFETPEAYDEAFEKKFNEEFDKAYLKLPTQRYEFPRVSHCFMEPHVSVVVPLVDGGIELWSSEQGGPPHQEQHVRRLRTQALGLPRPRPPSWAAGFGSGKDDSPCTGPAIMLALKCKRPVKIVQTREEDGSARLSSPTASPVPPPSSMSPTATTRTEPLAARRVKAFVNCGAYTTSALVMLDHSVYGLSGNYRNPNLLVDAYGIYTNTQFNGPLPRPGLRALCLRRRAQPRHGRPSGWGIDKYEIRRRNVLHLGDIDGHGQVRYQQRQRRGARGRGQVHQVQRARAPGRGPLALRQGPGARQQVTLPTATPAPRPTS